MYAEMPFWLWTILLFALRQTSAKMNAQADAPAPASAAQVPPNPAAAKATASAPVVAAVRVVDVIVGQTNDHGPTTGSNATSCPTIDAITFQIPLPPAGNLAAMTIQDTSDGWGDEDHDGFDDETSVPHDRTELLPAAKQNSFFTPPPEGEDDFFGSFDAKPAKAAIMMKTSGRLALPTKKLSASKLVAAPAFKKVAVDAMEEIWDDLC
jgi:hypothetical protein